jgi:cytochrome c nitrite reductase small subunit
MVEKTNNDAVDKEPKKAKKTKKQIWTIVGIIVLALVVAGVGTGGYLVHLSNTSPEFCATCHIMERNVNSYLTSNDLDNVHSQANVACKDCHDYPVPAEVASGVNYLIGNYTVGADGELMPVTYDNEMCLQCHISYEHVAESTDFLERNPHDSHNGELECKTCHVSHGDQIDYCATCHDNGGQRMVGDEIVDRGTIQ